MRIVIAVAILVSFVWPIAIWFVYRSRVEAQTRVVERQVVVARCAFCSELGAIDRTHCDNCGARIR